MAGGKEGWSTSAMLFCGHCTVNKVSYRILAWGGKYDLSGHAVYNVRKNKK